MINIGAVISGRYEIIEKVGTGGGAVWQMYIVPKTIG